MFAKLEDAVKFPAPKVKVPLLIMVPFAIIFPAPPVKIPPELMVVFGRLIEYVLFANVIGDGIIKSLLTVVFPPRVFIPLVPLSTKLL